MSTKKNNSHATPLRACEVPQKGNKRRSRSIHEKELAEVAADAYGSHMCDVPLWAYSLEYEKTAWRAVVQAVLNEAMFRLEAKFNKK